MDVPESLGFNDQVPDTIVTWGNSTTEICDTSQLAHDYTGEELFLFKSNDFPGPVEGVAIKTHLVSLHSGEVGRSYTATIDIVDGPVRPKRLIDIGTETPTVYSKLTGSRSSLITQRYAGNDITISQSLLFETVFVAADTQNNTMLIWVNRNGHAITISNDLTFDTQDGSKTEVIAPKNISPKNNINQLTMLMRSVMLVVEKITNLPGSGRSDCGFNYRLNIESQPQKKPDNVMPSLGSLPTSSLFEPVFSDARPEHVQSPLPVDRKSLDDIGGLEQVKTVMRDIITSYQHPEIMRKWGAKRPRGILLHGPPGNGKTMVAHVLADELGATLRQVTSTDIYNTYLGNSEKNIKNIFEEISGQQGKLVVVFDEFESIIGIEGRPGSGGADASRNAVAGIFKQEMTKLADGNPDVIVVATTNNLDVIDQSLIRSGRFDHIIHIPSADVATRTKIIANQLFKSARATSADAFSIFADDLRAPELAEAADGLSGADLTEIVRRLCVSKAMHEARTGKPQDPISHLEYLTAIKQFRQS